ncbi:MAG: sel1 repeat family protein [Lachnospiraceae bacterium]|nr:sel1 repeat family protein [Lachnospiraceae bacterium]
MPKGGRIRKYCCMNQLGAIYNEGVITKRDVKESFEWYKKSADSGYALAMSNMGFCYLYGNGVEIDEKEASCYST